MKVRRASAISTREVEGRHFFLPYIKMQYAELPMQYAELPIKLLACFSRFS